MIKCRPPEGGVEVWAIYPSREKGGAKLSLLPGLTDHSEDVREAAQKLVSDPRLFAGSGGKIDLPLGELADRQDWIPIFDALAAARDDAMERS